MFKNMRRLTSVAFVLAALAASDGDLNGMESEYVISDQAALELGMTPADEIQAPLWEDPEDFLSFEATKSATSGDQTDSGRLYRRFDHYGKMAKVVVIVDKSDPGLSPTAQSVMVYYNGEYNASFPASTGSNKEVTSHSGTVYKTVTRSGIFRPERLYYEYDSALWGGVAMNDATFIDTDGNPNRWNGTAFHAASTSRLAILGLENITGGCINLAPDDAGYIRVLIGMTGNWRNRGREDESFESDKNTKKVMRRINRQRLTGTTIKVPAVDRWSGELSKTNMVDSWDAIVVVRDFSK